MLKQLKRFWKEEDGMGVVEIALIIIVLISLVVIFKDKIVDLVNNLLETVTNNASSI